MEVKTELGGEGSTISYVGGEVTTEIIFQEACVEESEDDNTDLLYADHIKDLDTLARILRNTGIGLNGVMSLAEITTDSETTGISLYFLGIAIAAEGCRRVLKRTSLQINDN